MTFVTAYSKATGRAHRVPAHFLDNPVLCRDLTLDAPAGADQVEEPGTPSMDWLKADLEAFADARGVDLAGATTKQQIFDAIQAATVGAPLDNPAVTAIGVANPTTDPITPQTPATGENQE